MEAIDEQGAFWLPDHPDDMLSGRLRFHPADGITLDLVGTFDHTPLANEFRVHGWIGSKRVTLERCFLLKSSEPSPGVITASYHSNQIFLGHHINEEEPEFSYARAEFSHIAAWIDYSAADEGWHPPADNPGQASEYRLTIKPPKPETAEFSRGTVTLTYAYERTESHRGLAIRTYPVFEIRYPETQRFKIVQKDVSRLQTFIALCTDADIMVDNLTLTHPDIRAKMLSGEDAGYEQEVCFMAPRLKHVPPEDRKKLHPFQMLVSYRAAGGISAIARWLDESPRFSRSLDSMMSTRHARQMYAENRFLNVVNAAEAFHRVTQGGTYLPSEEFTQLYLKCIDNAPSEHREWLEDKLAYANGIPLHRRLRQLASRSAAATRGLIGDRDDWALAVSRTRNRLTHLPEDAAAYRGIQLVYLAESVFAVLSVCMLLEAGLAPKALEQMRTSRPMTGYQNEIKTNVAEICKAIRKS